MIYHKKADYNEKSMTRESLLVQIKSSGEKGIVLQTCNRVEFYGGRGTVPKEVTRHLFRLICGLESVFLGETFIQGQVKEAYHQATQKHQLDSALHRLFQWAFLTGKRVRTETALSRGAMSHSHAVVEIIKELVADYNQKRFAFIGINKMNRTIMNFLKDNVSNAFVLCNRSFDKAQELENHFNCKAHKLDHLKSALEQSDIVISGTSAPHSIIKKEHIPQSKPLILFDLAVPADADTEVQSLANIQYYNLKRIEQQVNGNKSVRAGEVVKAELIIEQEISRFMEYQNRYFLNKQQLLKATESFKFQAV
jgi:glutamyl-tRNA reductase